MKTADRHILFWKGRQSGPFTLEEIRAKLDSGEVSMMHEVNFGGRWLTLDEFLSDGEKATFEKKQVGSKRQREAEMQMEVKLQQQRESQQSQASEALRRAQENDLRQKYEMQLSEERTRQQQLQQRLDDLERRVSGPLPLSSNHAGGRRTSGMAVTALVMSLLNFVPFINFVSWIFAIVFGHIALSQTQTDPTLEGRGMAVAALAITYTLLALVVCWALLIFIGVSHLPKTR